MNRFTHPSTPIVIEIRALRPSLETGHSAIANRPPAASKPGSSLSRGIQTAPVSDPAAAPEACARVAAGSETRAERPARRGPRIHRSGLVVAAMGAVFVATSAHATVEGDPPGPPAPPAGRANAGAPGFERDIAPLLRTHCQKCHGEGSRKGGLDLRSMTGILQGGESGDPAIVPGKAGESLLVRLVAEKSMPPGQLPKLGKDEVGRIKAWIDAGAPTGSSTADSSPSTSAHAALARKVGDILEFNCLVCHGRRKREGGLDLRTVASMRKGGKTGPALIPGNSAESLLVRRIRQDEMPTRIGRSEFSVKPISAAELDQIRSWIDAGAPEPPRRPILADDAGALSGDDRSWWSFQPPKRPEPPRVRPEHEGSVRNPIDAFLLARLERAGLGFAPEADRTTLLRRVSFDLTGLPPTPAEIDAYLNDEKSGAYERLVGRLLDSPRYGERWGQHWLDAAGYSESDGGDGFDPIRTEFHHYRDYVIRALNSDKPYDRFLLEQLAGDEIEDFLHAREFTPAMADNLIATGFLRTCVDPTDRPVHNFPPDRAQVLADTVQIVDSTLLGLTLGCARCHSHKYNPISHKDYYAFSAIFAAAYTPLDWRVPKQRLVELGNQSERDAARAANDAIDRQVAPIKARIEALAETFKPRLYQKKLDQLPEAIRSDVKIALELPESKRSPIQKYLNEKLSGHFQPRDEELLAAFPEYQEKATRWRGEIAALEAGKVLLPRVRALTDTEPTADPYYLLKRGEAYNRGGEVLPDVPAVLSASGGTSPMAIAPPWPGAPSTGRRLAFARWLTRPDHPLTARVFVNRVWQQHFGNGLVATPDDFGRTGAAPTHPELLDWLATEFVRRGWSIKAMHTLIVTSTAYRQSSRKSPELAAADPRDELLGRFPFRRLDAEAIHDSILAIAGSLNLTMYGPASEVAVDPEGQVVARDAAEHRRRGVYMLHRRSQPLTVIDTFDAPRMTINCVKRRGSTVASQALLMLNSEWILAQAERTAGRLRDEAGTDPARQVDLAYRLVFARHPARNETERALEFLAGQARARAARSPAANTQPAGPARDAASRLALADFCLVLLNAPEFLYVD